MRRLRGIYFLALIAGCIFYIRDYRYWFALDDYQVKAQSQIMEQRLWEIFPKRCLTFWPYMYSDAQGIKEFLERDMPVIVETESSWTGKFTIKIEWLKAWIKVQWRGKIWCISRDGKMWEDRPGKQNDKEAERLIWKVNELEEEEPPHIYGVFETPLSTELIASFIDEFRGFKWFEAADEITLERRAGMDLFTLKLSSGTQKFEVMLQREKYKAYEEQGIGQSIENIFLDLINKGGNHIIDATYEGKFSVRNL